MRNTALNLAMAGAALLALYASIGARAPQPQRRAINPPGSVEGLPFSNGILAGSTLYVAGQEGIVDGKLVPGGIGPETQAALGNIQKIVKASGLDMKDVASVTVFLGDIHDFSEMNKVYQTYFPDPKPARATVQAAALVNNARVEISAIAVKER
jgi:2-iminobutanoate/2-iminopropanoate deaminase